MSDEPENKVDNDDIGTFIDEVDFSKTHAISGRSLARLMVFMHRLHTSQLAIAALIYKIRTGEEMPLDELQELWKGMEDGGKLLHSVVRSLARDAGVREDD